VKSNGLKFNNKHSYFDYGLLMESKSIQPPSKKKIKVDVPGMNGSYDFSTIASGGEIVYAERNIKVLFGLPTRNKQQLYVLYSKILEWLEDTSQAQLTFDNISDYYFIAEIESIPTFEEVYSFGKLEVTFTCEPFKTSINLAGSDVWDTFNFEEDVVQDMNFNVVSTKVVSVYNAGRLITPIINSNAAMTVTISGKTYNLGIGDNKIYGLKLQNGYNSIVINGTGLVKFLFRKVVL